MTKIIQETDWNRENSDALEKAIFDPPKITKHIIEAMCEATGVEYMKKEKEINFFELLEQLPRIGLQGSKFICEKVKLSQEMNVINDSPLEKIEDLKEIVWQVNCKLKSVREAVQLEKSYSESVTAWTAKINQLIISENYAKTIGRELRIAGYTTPVMQITENDLVTVLNSFKGNEYKVVLFMNQKRVEIVDMPLLVAEIEQIGGAIDKIENWTEPVPRRPAVPQPVIHPKRRQSPPRRNQQQPRDNSSKKLKQRFDFSV